MCVRHNPSFNLLTYAPRQEAGRPQAHSQLISSSANQTCVRAGHRAQNPRPSVCRSWRRERLESHPRASPPDAGNDEPKRERRARDDEVLGARAAWDRRSGRDERVRRRSPDHNESGRDGDRRGGGEQDRDGDSRQPRSRSHHERPRSPTPTRCSRCSEILLEVECQAFAASPRHILRLIAAAMDLEPRPSKVKRHLRFDHLPLGQHALWVWISKAVVAERLANPGCPTSWHMQRHAQLMPAAADMCMRTAAKTVYLCFLSSPASAQVAGCSAQAQGRD